MSGEHKCKEINESTIHPSLNRDKMFSDGWWLQYCCCRGVVIGNVGEPYAGSEARNFCLHETCELTSVGDPFCSGIGVECCITSQCAFPKIDGSPTCVCCNKKLAGGDTGSWKPTLFDFTFGFDNQFWLYYFLCAGVSVHGLQKDGRPLLGFMSKRLCIKEAGRCTAPIQEGVFCSGVGTFLCCWNQAQFPPAPDNPKIACCGWKMNKGNSSVKAAPFSYGKPGQQDMKSGNAEPSKQEEAVV